MTSRLVCEETENFIILRLEKETEWNFGLWNQHSIEFTDHKFLIILILAGVYNLSKCFGYQVHFLPGISHNFKCRDFILPPKKEFWSVPVHWFGKVWSQNYFKRLYLTELLIHFTPFVIVKSLRFFLPAIKNRFGCHLTHFFHGPNTTFLFLLLMVFLVKIRSVEVS